MSTTITETAPDSCPFCGAAFKDATEGREDVEYQCGSWINHGGPNSPTPPMRPQRTDKCLRGEIKRLTREQDNLATRATALAVQVDELTRELEAHAHDLSPAMVQARNDQLTEENTKLLARVKRLEEAGGLMERRLERFSSGGLDTYGMADRQPASIEGLVVADFRLVEQAIQQWKEAKEAKP